MLFQEVEVTKSLSRNLLKQHCVSVDFEKTRVIDTNELAQRKIEELNRKMRESVRDRGLDEFEAGFTEGIEAIRVAQLLDDDGEGGSNEGFNEGGLFKAAPPVYEGPSEEEIQQMIEERLEEANRQAEEIVNMAQNEAVNIRNQAHSEGMRQGYDEGVMKARAEFQAMEAELNQKAQLLDRDYEMKVAQLEPAFVDAITAVYEQIFQVDLTNYHDILIYLVESIMKKSDEDSQFMIHVSPKDYEVIFQKKAELLSKISRDNLRVEIIEDMTVPDRQCIIETENGVFDCGIDTQLNELKNRLRLLSFQK